MQNENITRRNAILAAAGTGVALAANSLQAQGTDSATAKDNKALSAGMVGVKFSDESVFFIGEGAAAAGALGASRATVIHEEKLGNVCWMEIRFHPTRPCRDCRAEVWGEFEHPRINEEIDKIRTCLRAAAVSSAVVAVIAAISGAGGAIPSTAVATFKTVLIECLLSAGVGFAREISLTCELRNKSCEGWTSNCKPCD